MWLNEFKAQPWNSALQLFLGGMLIYMIAIFGGSYYGCGPGNSNLSAGAFSCNSGVMSTEFKVLMVITILGASLCWGRAMSLIEGRHSVKGK